MRRNNFLIGALVALVTFVALSAFVHRPWGRGWRYDHCYYDNHYRYDNRYDNRQEPGRQPANDSVNRY